MSILSKIQTELKAPKNQRNTFGNYNYRSCEDILEGVKPLLKEYKATIIVSDEMVMIGDRYYVKATATLKGLDFEEYTTAFAREANSKKGMDEAQVTGATSSYARKYALNGLLAIDDTKDADGLPPKEDKKPTPKKEPQEYYKLSKDDVDNKWNGKIYGKNIYIDEEKKLISDDQIKKLEAHTKYIPNSK